MKKNKLKKILKNFRLANNNIKLKNNNQKMI